MKRFIRAARAAVVGSVIAGGIVLGIAGVASAANNPPTTIVGVSNPTGTLVTWTITVTGSNGSTSAFALLYPSHPVGSTTSIDPPQHGPQLTIVGNGSVSFTESPAAGTTFCGQNIDVSVDLLEADVAYSDLPGQTTVTCAPPTTTTTTQPPVTTTTVAPPTAPCTAQIPGGGEFNGPCPGPDLSGQSYVGVPTPPADGVTPVPAAPAPAAHVVAPVGAPQTGFGGAATSGTNWLLISGSVLFLVGLLTAGILFATRKRTV